jgi:hypothetical protein
MFNSYVSHYRRVMFPWSLVDSRERDESGYFSCNMLISIYDLIVLYLYCFGWFAWFDWFTLVCVCLFYGHFSFLWYLLFPGAPTTNNSSLRKWRTRQPFGAKGLDLTHEQQELRMDFPKHMIRFFCFTSKPFISSILVQWLYYTIKRNDYLISHISTYYMDLHGKWM